ncbi:class I SAM-dependent methyltransferase [Methylobacterium sp. J-090]|uniref:class I SAM-dependent methyltransferase n=1 Tax=Methylobacterium sp. J-090 TaxID=2836666 RepID=UPI001FBA4DDD|nr:class I SAM-dependent methyltransferase [Methylobacterium sp. J-090]MCJ2080661.1 class I SAM-dependent methyltransferase [Methylobacterium sp. J-090]
MDAGDSTHPLPDNHHGLHYMAFMAHISRARDSRRYLEIGVSQGHLLSHIHTETAIAVDPSFQISFNVSENKKAVTLIQAPSDTFFAEYDYEALANGTLDLAFLDGMHTFEYLLRDFYNTEAISSNRTLIVMHDCMPLNAEMADRDQKRSAETGVSTRFPYHWTGDVWKIIPILQTYRPDLRVIYVDCPPTGLVCVTNLDPHSSILKDCYFQIVDEFRALKNDLDAIGAMYRGIEITSSAVITNDHDLTLYFGG